MTYMFEVYYAMMLALLNLGYPYDRACENADRIAYNAMIMSRKK